MTKKQFGIIFTLMALIVCVGVLAMKLNSDGLVDPTDFSTVLNEKTDEESNEEVKEDSDKETSSTQDNFYNIRIEKEQQDSTTIQDLNMIKDDENASQEQKDIAINELTEKTMIKDKEGRIELNVKNKGFEDVLCFIQDNRVRVVVKTDELTAEDSSVIQEIVEDVSAISNVIIEPKK